MTQVRKLVGEDATTWRTLRLEALSLYPTAYLSTHDEAAAIPLEDIAAGLDHGHTFGVFDGDDAVGMASLVPQSRVQTRHRGEVGGFYVRRAAQGQGAADLLLGALIGAAQALGVWQLELNVAASNARAIRFYARHGFVECGRIANATLAGGAVEDDLLLIRSDPPGA
ncbi:GNAT family N-acetyltransferase [Tateyamaria sp. SN6-1]|uniref:GNAT family N-acetyltransferase n=1 Tax=Tateyamaria sp. SN6-1 TaxID=3092148 RepID=UPI0039F47C4A